MQSHNKDMEENRTPTEISQPFELTLESYRSMIFHILNRYNEIDAGDYMVSKEDLYQEACIALYDACRTYSPDRQTKFSTFAYSVIKRRVEHKLKTYLRPLRTESYSVDAIRSIDYYKRYSDNEYRTRQHYESKKDTIHRFLKTLSEEELQIIKLRQHNYSYEDISRKMKLNKKKVDNQIQKLKRDYRNFQKKERFVLHRLPAETDL